MFVDADGDFLVGRHVVRNIESLTSEAYFPQFDLSLGMCFIPLRFLRTMEGTGTTMRMPSFSAAFLFVGRVHASQLYPRRMYRTNALGARASGIVVCRLTLKSR